MVLSWQQWQKWEFWAIAVSGLWSMPIALGQTPSSVPLPTPNQETLPQPSPTNSPPIRLSPSPNLPTPSAPSTDPSTEAFQIDGIQVVGNTLFEDEIQQLIAPLGDRWVTLDDLLNLRTEITTLYQSEGYLSSGAFLPKQSLTGGTIRIQVVESQMERVEIRGLKRLNQSYVRDRLKSAVRSPLNQRKIEQALQQLQQDPLFDQVTAKLSAGSGPGFNRLDLDLVEALSKTLALQIDNHQAPAIGEIGGTIDFEEHNLTGRGDRIRASYSRTEGLNQYDASYQIPFNPQQGTIEVRWRKNDTAIIADDFRDLDIRSETDTVSLEVRQPLIRRPNQELALGARVEIRNNQTQLDGTDRFSFEENADDGRTRVRPIRLYVDWTKSRAQSLIALRSQMSFGFDWLGSSDRFAGASGEFFSWLGQAQWVRRISENILLLSTLNLQLTPDELLALEQYSLGGRNSVRGYIQNFRLGDNGINGTLEARIPVGVPLGNLTINPFFDAGAVWNASAPSPEDSVLASLGIDLVWQPIEALIVQVGYGHPLLNDSPSRGAIQDAGVTFVVRTEHQF